MAAIIYYDGECPLCANYTSMLKLREAVGPVELVNVRENAEALSDLSEAGYDLDDGMVFEHQGRRYAGAEAVHRIAQLTEADTWSSRINALLFRSPLVAGALYPLLRGGRNALLAILGKDRINPSPENDRALFGLFAHAWGICAVLQAFYAFFYKPPGQMPSTVLVVGVLGMLLAVRPRSALAFAALCVVMAADSIAQMPSSSNSTILKNFVLLSIVASAAWALIKGRNWSSFVEGFAPIGRCLLIVMYFFGVFHKLNTGFFDPIESCAVALWYTLPSPINQFDELWFRYVAIFGTLLVESLILVGLLRKNTRHIAVISGIAFHGLLALCGYGFYPTFSTLTISLHLLYLSPGAAMRITSSPAWRRLEAMLATSYGVLAAATWFVLLWVLVLRGNSTVVGIAWTPWAIFVMYLVFRYGRERQDESPVGPAIYSRNIALNVVSLLFFLNCFAPYLGLKTAQSINMFANLQLEGGKSNHVIMTGAPGPFGYLADVVLPKEVDGNASLLYARSQGLHVTYYDLLNQLERSPDAVVSFERNGVLHENQNAKTLASEIERELHPRWVRALFAFNPADMGATKRCWISQ